MPDFLKKAQKRTDAVCDDGETPLAALFVRPRSEDGTKRLGAPGGALSKMNRLADRTADETNPFDQNCVLVLTDRRLLAFGHGTLTGRVRDLIGALPNNDIVSMSLERPEQGAVGLVIAFADGDSVELAPGSRSRSFVDAFEKVSSRSPQPSEAGPGAG
jgi:hypothetical protein